MSKIIHSDQEWLELVQEHRTSGLSDREWCQMHEAVSTKLACSLIPYPEHPAGNELQVSAARTAVTVRIQC